MRGLARLAGIVFVSCAACRQDPPSAWRSASESELASSGVAAQRAEADAARTELAQVLQQRLTSAMQAGGAPGAVSVCRDEAPRLAREVAEKHRVRIGRTSFRLRNPDNRPPAWADAAVEQRTETPQHLLGPGGELGVLSPIRLQPLCVTCHGAPESIDPAVRDVLAKSYPGDEATGFAPGELRGWFWVEVPRR